MFGVVIGILPLLVANMFMRQYVHFQGQKHVEMVSSRALNNAEHMIQEGIDVLSALPHYRFTPCEQTLKFQFRKMIFRHTMVHDVGLVYNDGFMYCSSQTISPRFTSTSAAVTKDVAKHLSYMAVLNDETGQEGLLIKWHIKDNFSIGSFILNEHLLVDGMPVEYAAHMRTTLFLSNNQAVARISPEDRLRKAAPFADIKPDPAWMSDLIESSNISSRYPISVSVAVPFSAVWASFSGAMNVINGLSVLTGALFMIQLIRLGLRDPDPYYAIRKGIKNREFVPYYQPVIDIQTGRLAGCEVLVRWRKADGSIVPPGQFISLAEVSGLALSMTTSLMEQVAEDLSDAYAANPSLKAGINLFNRHFNDLSIVSEIQLIFGNSTIRYEQLMFEVTERHPLENLERARAIIRRMQALGVKVALDDAGAGHGGFAYLQKLGMDVIKIDKLFVDSIGPDSEHVPIVDSLCQMAKGLGMVVVAEGVETEDQVAYLRRAGVDQAQGFLFAPALPASAYLELVAAMSTDERKRRKGVSAAQSGYGKSGELVTGPHSDEAGDEAFSRAS